MIIDIEKKLMDLLHASFEELSLDEKISRECFLDIPSSAAFGDSSTNIALRIASLEKKKPALVASRIVEVLKKNLARFHLQDEVSDIKVAGPGFVNFYYTDGYFREKLKDILTDSKKAFTLEPERDKNVLIEFVSANPTGPLSVAHARQAAVGDVLANIMSFAGVPVSREYYLNDEGNQITILGNSIELRLKELNGETVDFPENHYQGDYIRDIAQEIKERKLQIQDFSDYGADYILGIIKKELEDFGVRFDCWYSQKSLRKSGKIQTTLDFLKDKGFLFEEDGALWLRSTAFGDDKDRVVIKSDGSYTYLAPDIAYHAEKYKRGFNTLKNLWGPDHHGYINRLKASVSALGYDSATLSVIIVQLATIFRDGKPVQMSTRKGQYITLREVLDEVGIDAARFFFLMRRTSSHLDFDLEVAKKQTSENPVYYVQYAHARICSILRNSSEASALENADLTLLKEKEEITLIKKLCQFPYTLRTCMKTEDPYMLTVYLQELAEVFHKFYDMHHVLGNEPPLTRARLALVQATKLGLATGLELLGVSRPENM